MATPSPVTPLGIDYDGTNHDQVLDFLRQQSPDNPILRGGVVLEPAPGDLAYIHVEYTDGSILRVIEGDVLSVDLAAATGVQGATVSILPPVIKPPTA